MELTVIALIATVATVLLSLLIGSLLYKRKINKNEQSAKEKSKLIIKEAEMQAENLKKDKQEFSPSVSDEILLWTQH